MIIELFFNDDKETIDDSPKTLQDLRNAISQLFKDLSKFYFLQHYDKKKGTIFEIREEMNYQELLRTCQSKTSVLKLLIIEEEAGSIIKNNFHEKSEESQLDSNYMFLDS